jgi:hypothetical protein
MESGPRFPHNRLTTACLRRVFDRKVTRAGRRPTREVRRRAEIPGMVTATRAGLGRIMPHVRVRGMAIPISPIERHLMARSRIVSQVIERRKRDRRADSADGPMTRMANPTRAMSIPVDSISSGTGTNRMVSTAAAHRRIPTAAGTRRRASGTRKRPEQATPAADTSTSAEVRELLGIWDHEDESAMNIVILAGPLPLSGSNIDSQ